FPYLHRDASIVRVPCGLDTQRGHREGPPRAKLCFEILSHAADTKVVFETLWIVTNIASGNLQHTTAVIDAQCHLPIITLLTHSDPQVMEQAAWAVGNIAGESAATRDILLQLRCSNGCTLFEQLVQMYDLIVKEELADKKNRWTPKAVVVWVISNLCRGKPQPSLELVRPCFPFLRRVIREAVDHKEALIDAMWAVSYISDGSNDRIQEVLSHGLLGECLERLLFLREQQIVVSREHDYMQDTCVLPTEQLASVFEFLGSSTLKRAAFGCKDWFYDIVCRDVDLYARARSALTDDKGIEAVVLRILGNVVTGDDHQTEAALKLGFLDVVEQLARKHAATKFRKELCWSLSNVTAGTNEQIQLVIARPRIVAFVLASLQTTEVAVAKEAAWVVANACQGIKDITALARNGWLHGLVVASRHAPRDAKLEQVIVEGLEQLTQRVAAESERESEGEEEEVKEEKEGDTQAEIVVVGEASQDEKASIDPVDGDVVASTDAADVPSPPPHQQQISTETIEPQESNASASPVQQDSADASTTSSVAKKHRVDPCATTSACAITAADSGDTTPTPATPENATATVAATSGTSTVTTPPKQALPNTSTPAELIDEGISILLAIVKKGYDSADIVSEYMAKYPQAFVSARSYYYMMLLPFGLITWFTQGKHQQLLIEGVADVP
ncbi:importin alpha homolog, putative, partial [Bodo saltans]